MPRDHHVPQFYLRNFQIPGKPGLIYSYKRKLTPRMLSIRKVAQSEDYYRLKDPNNTLPVDSLDRLLQTSEEASSQIIKHLLTASFLKLPPDDFGHLLWFLAIMAFRTPFAREAIANLELATTWKEFKKHAADEDAFASGNLSEREDPDLRERTRLAILNDELKLNLTRGGSTEDHLMGLQLGLVKAVVPIFARKYWNLVEPFGSRSFITSDHPVVLIPAPSHQSPIAPSYEEGWFLFPLSPTRGLLLTTVKLHPKVISLSNEKMKEYQFYIITRCYQSVFAHSLNPEYQRMLETTEEGEVVRVYLQEE